MGLLEKLRPQPKWKHADPTVRLEGLNDVDESDHQTLHALASDDPDSRVRRAAVDRVSEAAVLAGLIGIALATSVGIVLYEAIRQTSRG